MTERELLDKLLSATKLEEAEAAYTAFKGAHADVTEFPFGGRNNNAGQIDVAKDPGRSMIERVTNGIDALLEREFASHAGNPVCISPREAASAWLNVPLQKGLAGMSQKQRQELAERLIVRMEPGEGAASRILSIIDRGIGMTAEQMPKTILSLGEDNKVGKLYLAGTYGQGGSSTLSFSKLVLIATRVAGSQEIAFTVVRYMPLPSDTHKTGRYVYAVRNDAVLRAAAVAKDFEVGTIARHFGYDLTNYKSPIGPNSVYGALNRLMFDPVAPMRFENVVHGWNRVIKGTRNALNGAVDQGDEGKGPTLDHNVPMFSIEMGDLGHIGVEYWVLERPEPSDDGKPKNPAAAFVDPKKPVVITHNGQNQGELPAALLNKAAQLPFLTNRLIVHVNCDRLSPDAKRNMFSSTREDTKEGFVRERIEREVVELLKADDELDRLNREARDQTLKDKDKQAEEQMKRQVARMLRFVGAADVDLPGSKTGSTTVTPPKPPKPPPPPPEPIPTMEPPTFIRIVGDPDVPLKFYAGQRRWIRVETDANSDYHNPNDPEESRINVAVGDSLKVFGTTPLSHGRMRIGVECSVDVSLKTTGSIRIELYRKGLPALSTEREFEVVEQPKPKEGQKGRPFPEFKVIAVDDINDPNWPYVTDQADSESVEEHASGSVKQGDVLYVYYSELFPRYAQEAKRLAGQSPGLAASFKKRYELWLVVHALLVHQKEDDAKVYEDPDDAVKDAERKERCRLAAIAAMYASQEARSGVNLDEISDAA